MAPSSDSSDTYTSTVQSGPPSTDAALSRHPVSKPLIPHLPILYLLPLPLHHRPLLLAIFLRLLPPLLPLTLSGFFNGMLEVSVPGALNYFIFYRPIQSILSAFRNPTLTHLPLSGFLDSLFCVLIAPTPGLAFSLLIPRTPAAVSSFSSGRAYPFLNFLSLLFLRLIPILIIQNNISPNNSSSVSFLNVYAPPPLFAPPQRMAEPIPFLPPFFPPPEISSFWGTSIAITPSGTQEVLPTPAGRKYSSGSSPLTSSPSMTLKHPPFSIAPLAVAPPLTSPLLLLLLFFLAPGRCFRTWVLTTHQFFYLSLSLSGLSPQRAPPFLQFSESLLGCLCLLL